MAEEKTNEDMVFTVKVNPAGYSIETNMSPAEAVFWLDILHTQYAVEIIAQNKSA